MPRRISDYARRRMRRRHLPAAVVMEVFDEPDGVEPDTDDHPPDREIRWRLYDGQRVEIVVDLIDGTIVSAWVTRVKA